MALIADILSRVRLEISDQARLFQAQTLADGMTNRFSLPDSPVSATDFRLTSTPPGGGATTLLSTPGQYTLDAGEGVYTMVNVPADGTSLVATGTAYKFFTDADLTTFINTAVLQHLHNRQGVTLATLPPVEDYAVALLASIEALYALMNDAAYDIDVSTPEGVGIPRSQRFNQLQGMIEHRKQQYAEIASALNVGLNRIEMFNLRRVSRTTGRLVPVYLPQEIEDRQPPTRVFTPIDTMGGEPIVDGIPIQDITVWEYGYYTENITIPGGVPTGWKVDARIRRYKDSSSLREFTVTVNDATTGAVTLDLTPLQTGQLPQKLWYDIRLTNKTTREVRSIRKGLVTVIQQVGVDEAVGPATGGGY